MKKLTTLFLFLLSVNVVSAQSLFTYISDADANLNSEQLAKLNSLRENPVNESITMVNVGNLPQLQVEGDLYINLPDGTEMLAKAYKVINESHSTNPSEFLWEGGFTDGEYADGRILI